MVVLVVMLAFARGLSFTLKFFFYDGQDAVRQAVQYANRPSFIVYFAIGALGNPSVIDSTSFT